MRYQINKRQRRINWWALFWFVVAVVFAAIALRNSAPYRCQSPNEVMDGFDGYRYCVIKM